ncbi:hypothetical protein [Actinoplanes derwentensis]|uniref:Uncharacterized protein n=1 Tax=Actinoplanes derwentensis TaxID=113562 RepID=A0A1H2CVU5_9ACTN|nr:hypothetical protein [Actinoplanes derwentensis]GID82023.1 hypothetical protein Ade03nite_09470 [Actinoplanes derwentensis]SDT74387.1 hypothetical protein SAMN04489716_6967 [Actinoplanes derwentensis]
MNLAPQNPTSTTTMTPSAEPASDSTVAGVSTEPTAEVSLDLDALNKFDVVDDAVAEPFLVRHQGHVFTFADPRDSDWKDLLQSIRNPVMAMRYALPEDQQDVFYGLRLEAWKINVLMERWHKHYKLPQQQDFAKLIAG